MMTREKILPEDLIQKTNIRQHNLMIGAINEIDERQGTVEDMIVTNNSDVATVRGDLVALSRKHEGDIAVLAQDIAAVPDVMQPIIINTIDTNLTDVLVDDDMLRFSADRKAIFLQKNCRDGRVVDEQIPLSTRQNVGLATPEDLLAIDELTDRVTTLENSGITGELFYLDHDFSGVTDAVRTVHFNADIGKPPTVGDSVIDSQQKSWRYVITGPATFGWVTVPHLSIGGDLKAVKSSNADGKVYVESDNTCSVVGWNGVKNDISGNASAIGAHAGNMANPHGVTKVQIGLGAYPESPADIGISTATQTALDLMADKAYVDDKIIEIHYGPPIDCSVLLTLFKNDATLICTPAINAENCTSLSNVFDGCSKLSSVGGIHCPNATNMGNMFRGCTALKMPPALDTSMVTYMVCMFYDCSALKLIPALDTSKVTDMGSMFYGCSALKLIPALDTSMVMSMRFMFYNCSSLQMTPALDTSMVTSMGHMFYNCSSLTSVTFQCADVRPYGTNMFYNTPIASGNGRIYVPDSLVQAYKTASGWSTHASVIYGHSAKP